MATTTTLLTVTTVTLNVDLRKVHAYRKKWQPRLHPRQAALLINRAKDRARLIDSVGGCHNYYAPDGEAFDVRTIQRQVRAFGLRLAVHPDDAGVIDDERPAKTRRAA